jgi:hypothetical protein
MENDGKRRCHCNWPRKLPRSKLRVCQGRDEEGWARVNTPTPLGLWRPQRADTPSQSDG